MTEDTDLDRLFTHLSDEGRRRPVPDAHPVPEKLSAYLANELSPEEDDALQEHLTDCTLCTDLLLDLQRFLDPPEEDRPREGVADFETAAEWRELRGRMGEGVKDAGGGKIAEPSRIRRVFGSVRVWQGVAAVLAVGLVWMSSYSLNIREESLKPEVNSIYLQIASSYGTRGGGEEKVKAAELQGRSRTITLILLAPPDLDYPEYQATIVSRGTREAKVIRNLVCQTESFVITLPPGSLKPGIYDAQVDGLRNRQTKIVGKYEFQIEP